MTPEQALELLYKYGLWESGKQLPEKASLVLYEFDADGGRISHRFRVENGVLVSKPKEDSNA